MANKFKAQFNITDAQILFNLHIAAIAKAVSKYKSDYKYVKPADGAPQVEEFKYGPEDCVVNTGLTGGISHFEPVKFKGLIDKLKGKDQIDDHYAIQYDIFHSKSNIYSLAVIYPVMQPNADSGSGGEEPSGMDDDSKKDSGKTIYGVDESEYKKMIKNAFDVMKEYFTWFSGKDNAGKISEKDITVAASSNISPLHAFSFTDGVISAEDSVDEKDTDKKTNFIAFSVVYSVGKNA